MLLQVAIMFRCSSCTPELVQAVNGMVRHSVYNSLQFFQWLVILQCSGQSYGSSGSQVIGSEATVDYDQKWTNLTVNDHYQRGQRGQWYQYMGFKEKSLETIWFKAQLTSHSNTQASQYGSKSISLVVTIATWPHLEQKNSTCAYILCLLDPETYSSVFKLWFTLRVSANAEAPDFPTLFPSRLWKRVCVLQN